MRRRRRFIGASIATTWAVALAVTPALAHGDHDARPLARNLPAGPHIISLWQVYPDAGDDMTPHLIVMFEGGAPAPEAAVVSVEVDGSPLEVHPSLTTSSGWETTRGLAEGEVVTVTIAEGGQTWALDPLVVPPPQISMLPMTELIYVSIFLTLGTALWVARRTASAWRRPMVRAS